jgi:hypothetical protein
MVQLKKLLSGTVAIDAVGLMVSDGTVVVTVSVQPDMVLVSTQVKVPPDTTVPVAVVDPITAVAPVQLNVTGVEDVFTTTCAVGVKQVNVPLLNALATGVEVFCITETMAALVQPLVVSVTANV